MSDTKKLLNFDIFEGQTTTKVRGNISLAFFVAPKININLEGEDNNVIGYSNMKKDRYFQHFLNGSDRDSMLVNLLSREKSVLSTNTTFSKNFIPVLTNRLTEIQMKDVSLNTLTMYTTREGHNQLIPTTNISQLASDQLSIKFEETNEMDIYKLMGLWTQYINNVNRGLFKPHPDDVSRGVLDYFGSIYYFTLDAGASEILYFSKFTGVAPLNVPYSEFSFSKGSSSNIIAPTINFAYSHKEDMNPDILYEFNQILADRSDNPLEELKKILDKDQRQEFTDIPEIFQDYQPSDFVFDDIPLDQLYSTIPAPFVYNKDSKYYMNLMTTKQENMKTVFVDYNEILEELKNK